MKINDENPYNALYAFYGSTEYFQWTWKYFINANFHSYPFVQNPKRLFSILLFFSSPFWKAIDIENLAAINEICRHFHVESFIRFIHIKRPLLLVRSQFFFSTHEIDLEWKFPLVKYSMNFAAKASYKRIMWVCVCMHNIEKLLKTKSEIMQTKTW